MKQPGRVRLARLPTPLERMERLSDYCGAEIWIKRDDLTDTAASGNKIRKLEFSIARALEENADVLVTFGGIQSNHCRATAIMASRLGLGAHLVLRGKKPDLPDGNLLLDRLVGAEISYLPAEEYNRTDRVAADITAQYAAKGLKTYVIPVGASDEVGLWGYIECAKELQRDFAHHDIQPTAIVSATGSGGTLGGLILGKAIHHLDPDIIAFNVCDSRAWFLDKIARDFHAFGQRYGEDLSRYDLPVNIIDGYVGPGYGRATEQVFDTIGLLARLEGTILDPVYTGKAFDAMLTEIAEGRLDKKGPLVFIHTGGIYGLFPQRNQLFQTADQTTRIRPWM